MDYNPFAWYWKSEAGRLYSSARQVIVPENDADFTDWISQGRHPTVWPRDGSGRQTDDELKAVLTSYGLTIKSEDAPA